MSSVLKRLNLGSGETKKEGFINVDWQAATNPDIVHDLNVFPYPFPDGRFEYIEAVHVLEHMDRPFLVMKEPHRILKLKSLPGFNKQDLVLLSRMIR